MTFADFARLRVPIAVVSVFLISSLSLNSTIQAAPRNVQVAFKATNKTGKQKTDLDLIYKSDTNMTVSALNVAVQPVTLAQPTYRIDGNGTRSVTVTFDGAFPPDATVDVTITFKQEESNTVRIESKWTPPGSPDDIPIPGFKVDARGNYWIFNDSAYDIRIRGLSIRRNVSVQPNDRLAAKLAEGVRTRQGRLLTIPSGKSIRIGRFRTRVGAYLYSTFNARFVRKDERKPLPLSTAVVIHGHEGIRAMATSGLR